MINPDLSISFTKVALEDGWMGNMSPHPIVYEGVTWKTAEALFQALRFDGQTEVGQQIREAIRTEKSPMGAKMVAKKQVNARVVEPLSNQDKDNMRMVLRLKFDQHPELQKKLRQTAQFSIYEDCSARRPSPWGAIKVINPDHDPERSLSWAFKWQGMNLLGTMLMELRDHYHSTHEVTL